MVAFDKRRIVWGLGITWCWVGVLGTSPASAQAPPTPAPTSPPPSAVSATATPTREGQLEARVRELEGVVKTKSSREAQLEERLRRLEQNQTRSATATTDDPPQIAQGGGAAILRGGTASYSGPFAPGAPPAPGGGPATAGTAAGAAPVPGGGGAGILRGGTAAYSGPLAATTAAGRFNMPYTPPQAKAGTVFGPGFQIQSEDGEYQFQFHDLTQVEARLVSPGGQEPVVSTIDVPRQRWIFSGRLLKPFEYYVSLTQAFEAIAPLDVFLNIHFDDRLQFKLGRQPTPWGYEFYNVPVNATISPEYSLFYNSWGLNRDNGLMAWGRVLQDRLGYAVGIFNGVRNSSIDLNDFKSVVALVNFRPFGKQKDSPLEFLNIGGSVFGGRIDNVPTVNPFRTTVPTTGNTSLGPEFLALNSNVREFGTNAFWSLHLAWYYKHLSLIAEWESGFNDYAILPSRTAPFPGSVTGQIHTENTGQIAKTHLPTQGYYVQAGYFLTGETVSSRGVVKPLHNFDVRKGKVGLGAIELAARYNYLNIGKEVFTNGLADPNLWTNQLYTVGLGVNWYWTEFMKFTVYWEHAGYGNNVLISPGRMASHTEEVFVRWQLFF